MYRATVTLVAVVVLASSLLAILAMASAASTSYTLTGFVDQPGGLAAPPVPAGVTVDLTSRATGAVYTTTTGYGGEFTFTSSGTSGALVPGFWGLSVPATANVTLGGCKPCAVLPLEQNPTYAYYNSTQLSSANYSSVLTNVSVLPYNATLNGTVKQGSTPVQGAGVHLLAPQYNGLVLANTSTNATGAFSLKVPFGTWVLVASHVSGSTTYSNTSSITIASTLPSPVSPVLRAFVLSGRVYTSTGYVPTAGNATMFDPTHGYIYSTSTPPGGYYSFPTYLANFSSGNQTFYVTLSSIGYTTAWYSVVVHNATPISRSVNVTAVAPSSLGVVGTTLDFSAVNVSAGTGSLTVTTKAELGNETVLPSLPNVTVGQLWAQLGLDFNHSLVFPASDLAKVQAWLSASGPFFPAVQAGMEVNGTGFTAPPAVPSLTSFASSCSTSCGLTSSANISYGWNSTYTLNGTIPKDASSYTLSFKFAHPTTSAEVYNYTFVLPKGYVLSAGTTAPTRTTLVGAGPSGTWTKFTLVSKPSSSPSASASFTIVKYANLTAKVNVFVKNATFSSQNVINSTAANYQVVVGVGQNVSFTAANSSYPHGTNGTMFDWAFGDGGTSNGSAVTAYHTFTVASPTNGYTGTLNVTSSGGLWNVTHFTIYVVSSTPTVTVRSNATAAQMKTAGSIPYLLVDWGTSLHFNATWANVTSPNVISIATYKLQAKGFNQSANYSASSGATPTANWTVQFNGAGAYLTDGNVSGTLIAMKGWQYNLTLTVYSGTGTRATTTLVILVNDKQKPTPAFTILNQAGKPVSGSGIVEGKSGTATVRLNAANSTDPNNGTIAWYNWTITNGNTSNLTQWFNSTTVKVSGAYPAFTLTPQKTAYTVKLTVLDQNKNVANTTQSLTVSPNTTLRPILSVAHLTGATGVDAGKSYTYWVNVTVGGGTKAYALNLTVNWYLMSSSGTGSKTYFSGSPTETQFFNYSSNGTVSSTPWATGTIQNLSLNKTVRAQITWTPSSTGNFILYANATASNEFPANYGTTNVASMSLTVHPNPTTQLLEYGGIGAAVVAVIVGLVWWYRRPARRAGGGKPTSGRSGLERGSREEEDEER